MGDTMLPDEHGDAHPPPPSVAPVIVKPIQAHQSRTIRRAKLMMIWTVVASVAPDIVEFLLNLMLVDPAFANAISRWFPAPIRYVAMTAILMYAKNQITLRKITVAPIAGTEAAKEAPQAFNLPTHIAPAATQGDMK